eukprot:TRINITY_DN15174_c0_g1_i1.p1 TRINITY_DN15174_c0_g1~~TRINITY_DN15174_c0_g1_i1.p1  ORF type:complete len:110 (+),score=28.53 TRINITY_DN15174_c0_g1_i1:1-330(+)
MQARRQLYRGLLRAQRSAFAEDTTAQELARTRTRTEFQLPRKEEEIPALIQKGNDVIKILHGHVVQQAENNRGHMELRIKKEHKLSKAKMPDEKTDANTSTSKEEDATK